MCKRVSCGVQEKKDAYAATPAGRTRKLSGSEAELLERGKPLPRRRQL